MAARFPLFAGLGLLASLLLAGAAAAANQAGAQPGADAMAAHRAAYKLTLDRARDNADIVNARGIMVYEVMDACDGWATRQRFTLVLTSRDGQEIDTGSDYSTFETKDGRRIRFSLTQTTQGAVTSRISGEAEVAPDGTGRARYVDPEPKEEDLPRGTILPMMHTIQALDAARRGQRLLVAPLFDGTSAEGAQDSTTVISAWQAAQPATRFPALAALGSARMRVAFFDRNDTSGGGASAPEYEVGMRYFENGVADELKMDFGEFVIDGRMEELSVAPGGC
ncbi:MAG: cell envelope integrity EipB family protein [Acetobacteraceae bacterium]|nr:cell envelope integrity EipB family protein [Acetobacteraceae bacterium]